MSISHNFKSAEHIQDIYSKLKKKDKYGVSNAQKTLAEMTGYTQEGVSKILNNPERDVYIREVDGIIYTYDVRLLAMVKP